MKESLNNSVLFPVVVSVCWGNRTHVQARFLSVSMWALCLSSLPQELALKVYIDPKTSCTAFLSDIATKISLKFVPIPGDASAPAAPLADAAGQASTSTAITVAETSEDAKEVRPLSIGQWRNVLTDREVESAGYSRVCMKATIGFLQAFVNENMARAADANFTEALSIELAADDDGAGEGQKTQRGRMTLVKPS